MTAGVVRRKTIKVFQRIVFVKSVFPHLKSFNFLSRDEYLGKYLESFWKIRPKLEKDYERVIYLVIYRGFTKRL